MADTIDYKKAKNAEEAFALVKKNMGPHQLERFKVKADFEFNEQDREIKATGKGFELVFSFYENRLDVDLNLSLMLRPFKGKILEQIEKQLKSVV